MSETKTTTTAPKAPKLGGETFQSANDASKKAFMAYVEAGAELGAHLDRFARSQTAHATALGREAGEVVTAAIETGLKARETARKAAVELVEGSFRS